MPHAIRPRLHYLLLLVLVFSCLAAAGGEDFLPNARTIAIARERYGAEAAERMMHWRDLIQRLYAENEELKVELVNRFFNQIPNRTDEQVWGRRDYWATPVELLGRNAGDCEDFALAKYFTLRAVGVANDRLRITYVRAWIETEKRMESHMVLAYYPFADADPLILDNLVPEVLSASSRADLSPTMGFNAEGLWSAKQRGQYGRMGEVSSIAHWNELLARMRQER